MLHRILLASLVLLVGGLCVPAWAEERPEPRYSGKPLAYWMERLEKAEKVEERDEPAKAIIAFGPDAAPALPKLLAMLDDRSSEYREYVAWILCNLGPAAKPAAPALIRSLRQKKARSPKCNIEILGKIGPEAKEALPVLIEALDDPKLRIAAFMAICALGPSADTAIPLLRRTIRAVLSETKGYTNCPHDIIPALVKLGGDTVPLLVELLSENDPALQSACLSALQKIGPAAKSAAPALKKALGHEAPDVRRGAACALWEIERNAVGLPVLMALLKANPYRLDSNTASVLGEMVPTAKPATVELLAVFHKAASAPYTSSTDIASLVSWQAAIRKIEVEAARGPVPVTGHPAP